jgi:hypothetical protein
VERSFFSFFGKERFCRSLMEFGRNGRSRVLIGQMVRKGEEERRGRLKPINELKGTKSAYLLYHISFTSEQFSHATVW